MQFGRLMAMFLTVTANFAFANPQAIDSCQSHCSIGYDHENNPSLFCSCPKQPRTVIHATAAFPPGFARDPALQRRLLTGQTEADVSQVAANSCQANVDRYRARPRSEESVKQFLDNQAPSLCECVAQRVHYPVERECRRSLANEETCSFRLVTAANGGRPLRDPTLEDYQSCLVERSLNPPTIPTCENAACSAPPVCGAGKELVNLASTDACCPKYTCRSLLPATHGGSSSAQ